MVLSNYYQGSEMKMLKWVDQWARSSNRNTLVGRCFWDLGFSLVHRVFTGCDWVLFAIVA